MSLITVDCAAHMKPFPGEEMNAHKVDAGSIQRVRLRFEVIRERTDIIGRYPSVLRLLHKRKLARLHFRISANDVPSQSWGQSS